MRKIASIRKMYTNNELCFLVFPQGALRAMQCHPMHLFTVINAPVPLLW